MEDGRAFHRTAAVLLRAWSPQEERLMGSRSKWLSVANLRARDGRYGSIEAPRYSWVQQVHAGSCTLGGALYTEFSSALAASEGLENRSYVVPHAHASDHLSRDVLDLLQWLHLRLFQWAERCWGPAAMSQRRGQSFHKTLCPGTSWSSPHLVITSAGYWNVHKLGV